MKTGGNAFPIVDDINDIVCPGMTIRDYFAAKAIDSLITSGMSDEDTAVAAYAIADAMLKEREK